jgi:hypothetical protein
MPDADEIATGWYLLVGERSKKILKEKQALLEIPVFLAP